jgi:hypothetical protein
VRAESFAVKAAQVGGETLESEEQGERNLLLNQSRAAAARRTKQILLNPALKRWYWSWVLMKSAPLLRRGPGESG